MLEELKNKVVLANLDLVKHGLMLFTWGNVSGIDREKGLIVIKPSGVSYDEMKALDMVVVDMDGKKVEGTLRPSSDTPTHIEIYKAFRGCGGVAHTHSTYATAWAQSGRDLPCYGTTHADYFYGPVPCTRALTKSETMSEYEKNTGLAITERFVNLDAEATPAVLVETTVYLPGKDGAGAVYHAAVLEEISKWHTFAETLNPKVQNAPDYLMDKHYYRKHGKDAYYGQK